MKKGTARRDGRGKYGMKISWPVDVLNVLMSTRKSRIKMILRAWMRDEISQIRLTM